MAQQVIAETTFDPECVSTVAGVDVGFSDEIAQAAVIVLDAVDLAPVDCAVAKLKNSFPYIPGLLAFREGPSVLAALAKLTTRPDLLIFDGHGIAHPQRIGLAAHMGVILDHPCIGCAKSRLTGTHDEPGNAAGDWAPLRDGKEVIGAVLRTRVGVKPVYVSVGHRVDLAMAIEFVLRCTRGFKLPETTRWAHRVASRGACNADEM
ncbi:MAG: deoxyribonuclease V [Anaerolineae bacterium]